MNSGSLRKGMEHELLRFRGVPQVFGILESGVASLHAALSCATV